MTSATRNQQDARGSASQRGYDATWRKVRVAYLRAHPMCEVKGCPRVAAVVHHRDEDPRNNAQGNLMGMCRECHEQHHGRQASQSGCYASGWPSDPRHPWRQVSTGGGGPKVHGDRQ